MSSNFDAMLKWLQVLAPLVGGGLSGAILTQWVHRQRRKTSVIPLIERVNRNPLQYELRGIKLIRTLGSISPGSEVTNLRHYQFTLRNTSEHHLRNAEIQFEFSAHEVDCWVSRPSLSNTPLISVDAAATEPWSKAVRWRIPQLPAADSIEFGFQAVDPSTDKYEVALFSAENVIVRATKDEPTVKASRMSSLTMPLILGLGLGIGIPTTLAFQDQWRADSFANALLKGDRLLVNSPSDEEEVKRTVKESQIFESLNVYEHPEQYEKNLPSNYWVPVDKGGQALKAVENSIRNLVAKGWHYGPESSVRTFDILNAAIFAGDRAEVRTREHWYLPLYYKNGTRVEGRSADLGPYEVNYLLRKLDGKWLIQTATIPYVPSESK
jgi:hypothetical protein